MQVKFSSRGVTLIIGISGELDHHSAEYIRQKVDGEMIKASIKHIVFDFSKVSFMDSSGIGVIMGRYKNIRELGGKTAVANVKPQIRRIFEMSGMLKFIPVYDKLEDAVNQLSS